MDRPQLALEIDIVSELLGNHDLCDSMVGGCDVTTEIPRMIHILERVSNELRKPLTTPCPDCKGAGELRRNFWNATTKTHTFGLFPCYNCQGTGKVKVSTS